MRVAKSKLMIFVFSLIALLTYSFPLSSVFRIVCVMLFGGYMIFSNISVKINIQNVYIYMFLLFCVWGIASYVWAEYSQGINDQVINMLIAILTNLIVMVYIISNNEGLDDIITWLVPFILIYMVQSLLLGDFGTRGRFSITGAVNQFGIASSYIFLIAIYLFKEKKYNRVITVFLMILSVAFSVLSGSRQTIANLVIYLCMVVLFSKYDKSFGRNILRVVIVVILAIIALVLVMKIDILYQFVGKRIESLFSYYSGNVNEDLSALRRDYMKQDALILFKSKPLQGIGLNNFKYVARYDTYAHSNYYELLACLGIIGFLFYYIPIIIVSVFAIKQWKRNEPDAVIPLAILLCFLFNEFSNVSYMYKNIHYFIGIAAGMIFVTEKRYKSNKVLEGNN